MALELGAQDLAAAEAPGRSMAAEALEIVVEPAGNWQMEGGDRVAVWRRTTVAAARLALAASEARLAPAEPRLAERAGWQVAVGAPVRESQVSWRVATTASL